MAANPATQAPRYFQLLEDVLDFIQERTGKRYRRDGPGVRDVARECGVEEEFMRLAALSREMEPLIEASVQRAKKRNAEVLIFERTDDRSGGPELDKVQVIRGDSIVPTPVSWLWEGFLALGKVHIMAGAPGTGKTTLALGFVAAITSGGRWPDHSIAPRGDVLIWSGEDTSEDTLAPRLIAAGADLSRVHFVGDRVTPEGARSFDPATDFAVLEREAARIPALRFVLVDPIVSAIAGDGHKSNDVRRGLAPLVRFAQNMNCAVLGISHFSKGTAGRDPVERVTGSVAFGALARVVLATAKVPDEEGGGRIMVRAKSNIGPDGGGFKYDLRLVDLPAPHAGISATRPEWLGAIQGEAREILAAVETQGDPEERSATGECADMLREVLAGGRVQTKDARRQLKAQGFTDKQIRSAREKLGIKRARDGFGGADFWSLPDTHSCPVPAVCAQPEKVGMNGHEWGPEGMNDARTEADLIALVERVAALYGVSAGELDTMKAAALANPATAWTTFGADERELND